MSEPFGHARNLDVYLGKTLPRERERRPDEGGLLISRLRAWPKGSLRRFSSALIPGMRRSSITAPNSE
jgi:hypothetical protein